MAVNVLWLYLTGPWVGLQCMIVTCLGHTHLVFEDELLERHRFSAIVFHSFEKKEFDPLVSHMRRQWGGGGSSYASILFNPLKFCIM